MNVNWAKVRGFKTEDMLYPDRCMLKWQGFLLSDHNEVMDLERAMLAEVLAEEANEGKRESWDRKVQQAWQDRQCLRITYRTLFGQETVQGILHAVEADHLVLGVERCCIAYGNILDIAD